MGITWAAILLWLPVVFGQWGVLKMWKGIPHLPPWGGGVARDTAPLRAALSPGFVLWGSILLPCALWPRMEVYDSSPLLPVWGAMVSLFPAHSFANGFFAKLRNIPREYAVFPLGSCGSTNHPHTHSSPVVSSPAGLSMKSGPSTRKWKVADTLGPL